DDRFARAACLLGRKIDHPEDRATWRRRHADLARGLITDAPDVGGRFIGDPQQGGDKAGGLPELLVRRRAVEEHHRFSVALPGNDTAHGLHSGLTPAERSAAPYFSSSRRSTAAKSSGAPAATCKPEA